MTTRVLKIYIIKIPAKRVWQIKKAESYKKIEKLEKCNKTTCKQVASKETRGY